MPPQTCNVTLVSVGASSAITRFQLALLLDYSKAPREGSSTGLLLVDTLSHANKRPAIEAMALEGGIGVIHTNLPMEAPPRFSSNPSRYLRSNRRLKYSRVLRLRYAFSSFRQSLWRRSMLCHSAQK